MRNATNFRCILCFAVIIMMGCTGRNTNPGLETIRRQIDLENRRDAFMKDAVKIEEIEGQKVAVFEERQEQDPWTFFITFPEKSVVLVSTNRQFLQQMLARMRGKEGQRALPNSLHEWT